MMTPSESRILIVDMPTTRACNLREALVRAGSKVHVLSSVAAALMLVNRTTIDTAFIAYDMGDGMKDLCKALTDRNIPHIFTGSSLNKPAADASCRELSERYLEPMHT